jgi:Ulp1 family protease
MHSPNCDNAKHHNDLQTTGGYKSFDECTVIIVPVHVAASHWAVAVVDIVEQQLTYWDSMSTTPSNRTHGALVLDVLARMVSDASAEYLTHAKIQEEPWVSVMHWPRVVVPAMLGTRDGPMMGVGLTYPQQDNERDCGMFALACMSHFAAGHRGSHAFSAVDMTRLRHRTLTQVLAKQWVGF